jgi:TonB family protein
MLVDKEPYIDIKTLSTAIIYPEEAKRLRIEGKVQIAVLVSKTGIPQRYAIESTASPLLLAEVVRVVMNATFIPATRNNQPVDSWVSITIIFRL